MPTPAGPSPAVAPEVGDGCRAQLLVARPALAARGLFDPQAKETNQKGNIVDQKRGI